MKSHKKTAETTVRVVNALKVFGGVQVITIICSVIRTKLAALWLGPVGVGLMTIYNSTMELISGTTQLSIQQSGVRDLSQCRDDADKSALMSAVLRCLSLILSFIATLAVIAFSPLISLWAFGDTSHAFDFIVLSLWLVLAAVSSTEMAIMRATDRLKNLANTTLYTAITSLLLAVPLLYFLRIKAVIPILLAYYLLNCFYALLFRNKSVAEHLKLSLRQIWQQCRGLLKLGFYMTVSSFVTLLASNVFIIYLNRYYSGEVVGIYQAGYTLINNYVGLIFTAIAMEYYPRLSSVANRQHRTSVIVSHEIKVALYVLMPLIVSLICFSSLIVKVLYTAKFYDALPYIIVGATGVFFRAASWCMAFTILARGDGKMFVLTETASMLIFIALYIIFFNNFGFIGIGVAYVLWYLLYFLIVYGVYRYRYGLKLQAGISALLCLSMAVAALCLLLYWLIGPWFTLLIMLPPLLFIAYRQLR
ncbi:MAG: oligosaccharide flippase family protein [Muribaculaceae bacterium]|nr:oligosaccharide flippase family protein [Muribaculaceae bacterium]